LVSFLIADEKMAPFFRAFWFFSLFLSLGEIRTFDFG